MGGRRRIFPHNCPQCNKEKRTADEITVSAPFLRALAGGWPRGLAHLCATTSEDAPASAVEGWATMLSPACPSTRQTLNGPVATMFAARILYVSPPTPNRASDY